MNPLALLPFRDWYTLALPAVLVTSVAVWAQVNGEGPALLWVVVVAFWSVFFATVFWRWRSTQ